MTSRNSLLIYCIAASFLNFKQVDAYYCDHKLCREDQYCCGNNLCCDYVYSLWYFWVGIVFLVLMLSLCGGLIKYCYGGNLYVVIMRWSDGISFVRFPNEARGFTKVIDVESSPYSDNIIHSPVVALPPYTDKPPVQNRQDSPVNMAYR